MSLVHLVAPLAVRHDIPAAQETSTSPCERRHSWMLWHDKIR